MRPATVNKTGGVVTLDNAAGRKPLGLKVYGNTRQNLWRNNTTSHNGVSVTANADGSLTVSGTASELAGIKFERIYTLRPGATYTASVDRKLADEYESGAKAGACFYLSLYESDGTYITDQAFGFGTMLSITFVIPESTGYVELRLNVATGTTVSGTYRVMLNEGSEAQPWCPPGLNGIDELSVVTAGRNLYSNSDPVGEYKYTHIYTYDCLTQSMVGMKARVSFDLTTGNGGNWLVYAYQGTGLSISFDPTLADLDAAVGIITESGVTKHFSATGIVFYRPVEGFSKGSIIVYKDPSETGSIKVENIQIELGEVETDYEPYQGTITPIDISGHTLNSLPYGTCDELTVDASGKVTLVKRVGEATIPTDTSEVTWENSNSRIKFTIPASKNVTNVPNAQMCDKVPPRPYGQAANIGTYITASGNLAFLRIDGSATAADTVSKIGGGTYLYPLTTPVTIELPDVTLPKLPEGQATVYASAPVPADIGIEAYRYSQCGDGIEVSGVHSYYSELGQCIASRDTGVPEKKTVTKTVPYMSGFYDLSEMYGAAAYESREVKYSFDLMGDDRTDLQDQKSALLAWLASAHDADIHDDDIPGWHFRGSYSGADWSEGEDGESGTLEATFLCQPFLIADEATTASVTGSGTLTNEGMPVNPTAKATTGTVSIVLNGITQSVGTEPVRLTAQLKTGDNAVSVTGGTAAFSWNRKRL